MILNEIGRGEYFILTGLPCARLYMVINHLTEAPGALDVVELATGTTWTFKNTTPVIKVELPSHVDVKGEISIGCGFVKPNTGSISPAREGTIAINR